MFVPVGLPDMGAIKLQLVDEESGRVSEPVTLGEISSDDKGEQIVAVWRSSDVRWQPDHGPDEDEDSRERAVEEYKARIEELEEKIDGFEQEAQATRSPATAKAGAVLNAKNRKNLQEAKRMIDEVLASAEKPENQEEDKGDNHRAVDPYLYWTRFFGNEMGAGDQDADGAVARDDKGATEADRLTALGLTKQEDEELAAGLKGLREKFPAVFPV